MVGPEGQLRPSTDYIPGMDAEFNYFPGRVRTAGSIAKYGDDYSTYYDPSSVYSPTQVSYGNYGNLYGPGGEFIAGWNPYTAGGAFEPNSAAIKDAIEQALATTGASQTPAESSSADVLAIQEQFARNLAQTAGVNYDITFHGQQRIH